MSLKSNQRIKFYNMGQTDVVGWVPQQTDFEIRVQEVLWEELSGTTSRIGEGCQNGQT